MKSILKIFGGTILILLIFVSGGVGGYFLAKEYLTVADRLDGTEDTLARALVNYERSIQNNQKLIEEIEKRDEKIKSLEDKLIAWQQQGSQDNEVDEPEVKPEELPLAEDQTVTISVAEIKDQTADLSQLYTTFRALPHFKDGKIHGFKILSVQQDSIFYRLKLRRGDIWVSLDDHILDLTTAMATVQKYIMPPKAGTFRFGVIRQDKEIVITVVVTE